jgi:hypothetical protein
MLNMFAGVIKQARSTLLVPNQGFSIRVDNLMNFPTLRAWHEAHEPINTAPGCKTGPKSVQIYPSMGLLGISTVL